MLRSALVVAAFGLLATSCKSKEVSPANAADTGDSHVAMQTPAGDGTAEGTGPAKGTDDAAPPGSGTAAVEVGSGSADGSQKGSDKVIKGSGTADPKGGGETSTGDGSFTLTISAPDTVAAGSAATAKLTVKPGKGYHMNEDFPTNLKFEPPAGCTLAKAELEADDATEFDKDHLVFEVACTPASAGTYNVAGKLKFAVCTDSTCDPKRQAISFAVAAK